MLHESALNAQNRQSLGGRKGYSSCQRMEGWESWEVRDFFYGSDGYVLELVVTVEQHCKYTITIVYFKMAQMFYYIKLFIKQEQTLIWEDELLIYPPCHLVLGHPVSLVSADLQHHPWPSQLFRRRGGETCAHRW